MNFKKLEQLFLGLSSCVFFLACEDTEVGSFQRDFSTAISGPVSNEDTSDVLAACEEALRQGQIETDTVEINIPGQLECAWGENGNLSPVNGRIRARREQNFSIDLSRVKYLCNLEIKSIESQEFQYDDEAILTLDEYVLFSTQNYGVSASYPNGLIYEEGVFQKYKWSGENGLRDLMYSWGVTPAYCLGGDDPSVICQFPSTQTTGEIIFQPKAEDIINLGKHIGLWDAENQVSADEVSLGFIVTGDDNSRDCENWPIDFNVKLKYVAK